MMVIIFVKLAVELGPTLTSEVMKHVIKRHTKSNTETSIIL